MNNPQISIIMKMKDYFFNLKEISKICLLSAGLLFSASIFSQDITTGLKLHYSFEAVSGTNIPDDSGNGNVGTINGAATVATGQTGQGLTCTAKADFIRMPANINVGLTSFTYAAWVKVAALKNATRLFDFGTGADATNNVIAFIPSYNGDNGFMCLRYRPVTGTSYNALSTVKIPTGVWAHVAVTYLWSDVTSTGTATMYINGAACGVTTGLTFNPNALGTTADNYIGSSRWAQDLNGFGGTLDDIRLYNRALTGDEILILNGTPPELITAYNGLAIAGDLANVTADLTLPTDLGNGITVNWASTLPLVVTTAGKINRPDQYDSTVKLTATVTETVNGVTYTLKKIFTVTVKAFSVAAEQIAEWNFAGDKIAENNGTFTVTDVQTGFVGTIKNDARIRTIGTTEQFNVLDLGNGTGYFDMGTDIGKAIYSLKNYTMCGYFRVDADYAYIASNGNFYWTFSNTDSVMTYKNGYVIGRLNNLSQSVSTSYYGAGNEAVAVGSAPSLGAWHHFAYTQNGTVGTIYVDGISVATGTMDNLPTTALTIDGRTGTLFNWLGRSNYQGDVYLRKTMLYDFQLLSVPLTADDLNFGFEVPATIDKLNVAYNENPDFILPELNTEMTNLSLGDLSAVKSNLTLPTKGAADATISISWKSTNSKLIDATGVVTRPNYYNYADTLTATLSKNGQKVTKSFPAVVVLKDGSAFNNNLLVKYDFSSVSDSTVTDVAEKHLTGTLKQKAKIRTIGSTVKYNVLNLGDSIGYFDLGPEVGKLMYHLNDYTMSTYYRVDTAYTTVNLAKAGNFIWSFSNTKAAMSDPTGYFIGSLNTQTVSISPGYYTAASGNQAVSFATQALLGGWHNLTYTQSGTTGTIYVDGMPMATGTITNLPSTALPKSGQLGTIYNWIGRSCYTSDAYLRKTLIYDYRLYSTALTDEQIQTSVLDVSNTISALDNAYNETPNALKSIMDSQFKVVPSEGGIKIIGLTGYEKVSVYDITGRQLKINNLNHISTNSGVYIVRVNNFATKVVVK